MSEVFIHLGTGGGISSDEVTATRAHVLAGKTALTSDSNDEVVTGTLPDIPNRSTALSVVISNNNVAVRIAKGAYIQHDSNGNPEVLISFEKIADTLGVDPSKMLASLTIAGRKGTIVEQGHGAVNSYAIGKEDQHGRFWAVFRNGYYYRPPQQVGNVVHEAYIYIEYSKLVEMFGIRADNMTNDSTIAGVRGNIPRWICTTGDVITAWNNEKNVWDDAYAGRGRGLVTRIPNNHQIKNANWVFIPEHNLYPHNVRAGTSLFGMVGTLQDYGAGRVVFNGATFDGVLVSGVANPTYFHRSYQTTPSSRVSDLIQEYSGGKANFSDGARDHPRQYIGIADGGLKIRSENYNTYYGADMHKRAGFSFMHSINTTPFRTLRVGFKIINVWARDSMGDLAIFVIKTSRSEKPNYIRYPMNPDAQNVDFKWFRGRVSLGADRSFTGTIRGVALFRVSLGRADINQHITNYGNVNQGEILWWDMDISDINEQCFFVFGYGTQGYQSVSEVVITHIQLIN